MKKAKDIGQLHCVETYRNLSFRMGEPSAIERNVRITWLVVDNHADLTESLEVEVGQDRLEVKLTSVDSQKLSNGVVANGYVVRNLGVEPSAELLAWACQKWRQEVKFRPLDNVNRRPLDDAWRQVVQYAGGDPVALLGPGHDALLAERGPAA